MLGAAPRADPHSLVASGAASKFLDSARPLVACEQDEESIRLSSSLSVRSGGLLLRWSGCSRRLGRLTGAACVPSRMAAVASLTAMAASSFPSLHPMCPSGFSGAGGGRGGVRNGRSGFLRLGH
jgi:hypothetical protein